MLKGIQAYYAHLGTLLNQKTLLTRNADIVWSGGIPGIAVNSGVARYACIVKSNVGIIRQPGSLHHVRIRVNSISGVIYFQIWRQGGTLYNLVHSESIENQLVAGSIADVQLTNCVVEVGDYVGFRGQSGDGSFDIGYGSGYMAGSFRYKSANITVPATDADLDTLYTSSQGWVLTLPTYSPAPMIAGIGDSLMAGHPGNYTGLEQSLVNNPLNSILGQMYLIDSNYVYQNMGIGSQTSTDIKNRFTTNLVNLKPKLALLLCGVNDIAGGSISKATFLANYTTMLDACSANSIIPVVCKIIPWTAGTTAQMRIRDEWNTDLAALVATYTGAICIDFDSTLGQYDATGDAGNLWDIKTAYNADGVHLNIDGYTAMSAKIDEEIKKVYKFI